MPSNIITPPDFIRSSVYTILVIDPTQEEIETIALYCATTSNEFNIYVYLDSMNDIEWLNKAASLSTSVIINTTRNSCSPVKDRLAVLPKAYYYGEKNFLMNRNRIESPLDFFHTYDQ